LDQARNQTCLLINFINTFYKMSYIFFSDNKWFLHEGDLPVKPERLTQGLDRFLYERDYNQSIADIKAKALEIANPEIITTDEVPGTPGEPYKKGEFYQWPGTFEKKETLYANDKYEVKYKTEVAHLVLPPKEK
jgi:hypothetical protein